MSKLVNTFLWSKASKGDPALEARVATLEREYTTLNDNVDQLELEYSSLINRNYTFGENETPIKFNGKSVFVYRFNPNTEINLPGDGFAKILDSVEDIISASIFCFSLFGDGDTNNKWTNLPAVKRGDVNTQLNYEINEGNEFGLHNRTITGRKKFKGYIYYTKI